MLRRNQNQNRNCESRLGSSPQVEKALFAGHPYRALRMSRVNRFLRDTSEMEDSTCK